MNKKSIASVFVLASIVGLAHASDKKSQWVLEPEKTVSSIVKEEKGGIVGTDTTQWRGEHAMILYIKTTNDLYRCVDFTGKSADVAETRCYRLVN